MPTWSFTAPFKRCLHPRYFSVVCTETWPSKNWVCSNSPPAAWQSLAHVRRLSRSRHISSNPKSFLVQAQTPPFRVEREHAKRGLDHGDRHFYHLNMEGCDVSG